MGRLPFEDRSEASWTATQMLDRHQEISRLLVLGLENKEIAERLGIHPQTVSLVRNSPIIKANTEELQSRANDKAVDLSVELAKDAIEARRIIVELMKDENEKSEVRLSAAKDIMDRTHGKAVTRIDSKTLNLTAEDLEGMKQRACEAGVCIRTNEAN